MKVLEVNVDDVGLGGVYSLVQNVIHNKPQNLKIDIACITDFESEENVKSLGECDCDIYMVGYKGKKYLRPINYYKNLKELVKKNSYDCVHIHSDVSYLLFFFGLAAKNGGIKRIILHSHAAGVDGNLRSVKKALHFAFRPFLKYIATDFVSCSDLAGKWMFPNVKTSNIVMIKNGVNLNNFKFDEETRKKIREELDLTNNFVVGHVGRFAYQKNHEFLIRAFSEIKKEIPNAKLLLIGEGVLKENTENLVKEMGLSNDVIFFGTSNKVAEMLQAMDLFILPSYFEGLPVVGVEAQAAGLPVIFSKEITRQAKLYENVAYLPIKPGAEKKWVRKAKEFSKIKRLDVSSQINSNGFSIQNTVNEFLSLYEKE